MKAAFLSSHLEVRQIFVSIIVMPVFSVVMAYDRCISELLVLREVIFNADLYI